VEGWYFKRGAWRYDIVWDMVQQGHPCEEKEEHPILQTTHYTLDESGRSYMLQGTRFMTLKSWYSKL